MRALYSLAIRTYSGAVALASCFGNEKAKSWYQGRKNPFKDDLGELKNAEWIWVHASSLGEFEQGRPLIELLKEQYPQYKILLSFFSPSGYEIRKNYAAADKVVYLPSDTLCNARQWVKKYNIRLAVFIKYEFWFNYMKVLHDRHIPLIYISVILRSNQYFFKSYGIWFKKQLKNVEHFYVQDANTHTLLNSADFNNVTINGDTRFDRVAAIAQKAKQFPEIEKFIGKRHCIVVGSCWPPDEKLLVQFLEQMPEEYCMIMAPHDISESHIHQIESQLKDYQLYTDFNSDKKCQVLVVNTIGILSQLYQYARFVYIGGGFGVNIHNIQEPVTFGCPVVFGPKYGSFKEAVDLVELGGAFPIKNATELFNVFHHLIADEMAYFQASKTCKDYVSSQVGATEIIFQGIKKYL